MKFAGISKSGKDAELPPPLTHIEETTLGRVRVMVYYA